MDLRNVPILIWLMVPDSRVLLLQVHQDRDSQVVQVFRVLCGDHLVGADRVGAAMDRVPVLMTVSDPLAIRGVTHFRNASVNGRQPVPQGVQVLKIGRDRAGTGLAPMTDTIGDHLDLDLAGTIMVLDFVQNMMVDYYQIKVVEGNVLPINHQLVLIVVDGFQPIGLKSLVIIITVVHNVIVLGRTMNVVQPVGNVVVFLNPFKLIVSYEPKIQIYADTVSKHAKEFSSAILREHIQTNINNK
mmetsp:Transcript_15431/g.17285  ORF Transcript_15431/g.17285 Transcript_15431/m.17285 type:complete len:243 (-) Transcript_15431:22-750(-)